MQHLRVVSRSLLEVSSYVLFRTIMSSSEEFADRFAVLDDGHRSAAAVRKSHGRVDAHNAVQRGQDLRNGTGTVVGLFATSGRAADHLTHVQTAAGNQGAHDLRPMVPAGGAVD